MTEFILQPALYNTGAATDLFTVLDTLWGEGNANDPSDSAYYLVAGFATHNGGVRFFERFKSFVSQGGHIVAMFGGSRNSNMTSKQLVTALVACGVQVYIVNRRHILHTKLYGKRHVDGRERLVVSSGNFTGPGLGRNIEAVLSMSTDHTASLGFCWSDLLDGLLGANFDVFAAHEAAGHDPGWALLYDEYDRATRQRTPQDETGGLSLESLIVTLSHSDTARIMAEPGSDASLGSQYFWLSKDAFDFFPPLTIGNARGEKATYSCMITVSFLDLSVTAEQRVTFEAENNKDFRLGTGPLRGTKAAKEGDLAILSRRGFRHYDLRLLEQGTPKYLALSRYADRHIGARGKRYGYAPNGDVDRIIR